MKIEIGRIPALQVASVFGLCYLVGASAWLLLLYLIALVSGGNLGELRSHLGIAVTGAAATWLVLVTGLITYNQVARWFGGVKFHLNVEEDRDTEPEHSSDG